MSAMQVDPPNHKQTTPTGPQLERDTTQGEESKLKTDESLKDQPEALPKKPQQADLVGTTCMELALEGERLCQTGDLKNGVKFFEGAIKVGTTDDRTLSAIYSQLGNAYFYLEDYQKALEYHRQDVTLVHSTGDEAAEAKACGNLGNTLKMLGKFDEAASYCRRYLEISRKLGDEVGEGRALYNLGNVYHMQGKRMIGSSEQESGELPQDIKSSLQQAIEYYEANLKVVTKLNDSVAMGRAYGNLGNTHYLLGNFQSAVESHKKRLELATKTNDKSAERRAHLNLGNANVFLGNFSEAIENYSATLKLARDLNDKHTEAHSCYSLANTYTFLRDYKSAIEKHLEYLALISELDDKLGEGRACWSLVNIYQMVNDPKSALIYAKKHYEIARLLGDETGLTSARANIEELEDTIAQKQAIQHRSSVSAESGGPNQQDASTSRLSPDKRQEQEQRRFKKQLNNNLTADIDGLAAVRRRGKGPARSSSSERLFDMIAHFQTNRIDDQRCEIVRRPITQGVARGETVIDDKENSSKGSSTHSVNNNVQMRSSQASIANPISAAASAIKATYRKASLAAYPTTGHLPIRTQRRPTVSVEHQDQLFDLIATSQRQRMDEQRASLPALTVANGVANASTNRKLDQAGPSKLQPTLVEQPEEVPRRTKERSYSIANSQFKPTSSDKLASEAQPTTRPKLNKLSRHFQTVDADGPRAHDENFLDSLMRYQSTRFDDQRSEFPKQRDTTKKQNEKDNFFNLIVKFQSDRIDDQRSAPPVARNKDV